MPNNRRTRAHRARLAATTLAGESSASAVVASVATPDVAAVGDYASAVSVVAAPRALANGGLRVCTLTEADGEDAAVTTPAGAAAAGYASVASVAAVPRALASGGLRVGTLMEAEGEHSASVVLLHGLGDSFAYWRPFYEALKAVKADVSGLRWIALDAPKRIVWGVRMAAWFEYYTDRSGEDQEDNISETDLAETRAHLHTLLFREVSSASLFSATSCSPRLLLVGSSQGGSAALDAALRLPAGLEGALVGAVALRSLALGVTARAAMAPKPNCRRLPVLAVNGSADATFVPCLVRRQLDAIAHAADVTRVDVDGLEHDTPYDAEEATAFVRFLVENLGLAIPGPVSRAAVAAALPPPTAGQSSSAEKAFDDLSDIELRYAAQLGIQRAEAWDNGSAAVFSVSWSKLSTLQRSAAKALGYTEATWDEEDADDLACEKSWSALTVSERALAKQLGVTGANAWDNGTAPVCNKKWKILAAPQRHAAEQLGFNEDSWNNG